jgi:hypothetical protein
MIPFRVHFSHASAKTLCWDGQFSLSYSGRGWLCISAPFGGDEFSTQVAYNPISLYTKFSYAFGGRLLTSVLFRRTMQNARGTLIQ